MMIEPGLVIMWVGLAVLMLVVWRKKGRDGMREGFAGTWNLVKVVIQIIPIALLVASFLTPIIPQHVIAGLIGEGTGLRGIVIAAVAGGMLPSGPILSFPLAMTLVQTGAGEAQIVSFISGWSIYAFYRSVAWEIPTMGTSFALFRIATTASLPILAGMFSGVLFQMF